MGDAAQDPANVAVDVAGYGGALYGDAGDLPPVEAEAPLAAMFLLMLGVAPIEIVGGLGGAPVPAPSLERVQGARSPRRGYSESPCL